MSKEEKLDWIYKGATSLVDREEYLLGRKVDTTLDQLNNEQKEAKFVLPTPKNHVEHECIPPSIRDFNKIVLAEQVDLQTKLQEDPLIAIKKREEEARRQFLQNPVQLKKLQEALMKKESEKKKVKKKSKKKDSDLDEQIRQKLKMLKSKSIGAEVPKKDSKKQKDETLTTILMHKFNALKSKLSEDDLQDILNGKTSDTTDSENEDIVKKKNLRRDSSDSEEEIMREKEKNRSRNIQKMVYDDRRQKVKGQTGDKRKNSSSDDERPINRNRSRERNIFKKGKIHKRESSSSEEDQERSSKDKVYRDRNVNSRRQTVLKRSRRSAEKQYRRSRSPRTSEKYTSDREHKNDSIQRRSRTRSGSEDTASRRKKQRSRSRDQEKSSNCERSRNKPVRKRSGDSSEDKIQEDKQKSNDSDLAKKIMAQLKILRGEAENKLGTQKTLYPERPSHLGRSNKNSSSSSEDSEPDQRKNARKLPSPEKATYKYSDSEEENPKQKSFGLVSAQGKKIAFKNTSLKNTGAKCANKKEESSSKPVLKNVKKMSEEEKERLRREMMKNAKSRDKEREENLRLYREKNKKEEETVSKSFDADLVHNELMKSANHSSVEQRIKSKLNNIQRSSRHMESNFSKK